jgi:hypothetical protein
VGVGSSSALHSKQLCSEIEPEVCTDPEGSGEEEVTTAVLEQLSAGQVLAQMPVLPGWRWITVRAVLLCGWVALGVTAWGAQLLLDKLWG